MAVATLPATTFEPPKTFREFFERDPLYIRKWLWSIHCPVYLMEDIEHDLFVHLMEASKGMQERGQVDKLATYDPEKRGGSSIKNPLGAWAAYINQILMRRYQKLVARNDRGGVRGSHVYSLSTVSDKEHTLSFCDGNVLESKALPAGDLEELHERLTDRGDLTSKVFVSEFLSYVEEEDVDLAVHARTLMSADNPQEARELLGLTVLGYKSARKRLKLLARRYVANM